MATDSTPPVGIAHQHMAATVNSLLDRRRESPNVIRLCDFGCGDGRMLAHMQRAFTSLRPDMTLELSGLDIADSAQQRNGFFQGTLDLLTREHPQVPWQQRLFLTSSGTAWPFEDGAFDIIVSNQVFEHVTDYPFVLRQISRCMKASGISVNLFPFYEVLFEGHAVMPFVHRVSDERKRATLMRALARLGMTTAYHREKESRGWRNVADFATSYSHVITTDTNYVRRSEFVRLAWDAGLSVSLEYTKDLYGAKLLSYLGVRPCSYVNLGFVETLAAVLLQYVSCVTVVLRKVG